MTAAIEQKRMQPAQVAQMMLKAGIDSENDLTSMITMINL